MTSNDELASVRAEYDLRSLDARRLLDALKEQMITVVAQHQIALAVPIETRVKTWESVSDKLERKDARGAGLTSISDLAGLRLITLFQNDVERLDEIIRSILIVTEAEDTAGRLDENQFGYRSNHYICRIPDAWEGIPSYRGLATQIAEIQVRTLPQHMWAAASHNLQYKHEESAPPPLRRSINRVSAILELVDIEFSRILGERDSYIHAQKQEKEASPSLILNVDILSLLLADIFPAQNKGNEEDYDDFLQQIKQLGINDFETLKSNLIIGQKKALESDHTRVKNERYKPSASERVKQGVYFTHVGLGREALRASIGPLPGDSEYRPRTAEAPTAS